MGIRINVQKIGLFDWSVPEIWLIKNVRKIGLFDDLFWRYGWLKTPAIWLAENILVRNQGTKFCPNTRLVQEHSK